MTQACVLVWLQDCWHLTDGMAAQIPGGVTEIALCGVDHHSNRILECECLLLLCFFNKFSKLYGKWVNL